MAQTSSKAAIVTGAGSGVGRDTALLLAEAGYNVTLVSRTAADLEATAETVRRETGAQVDLLVAPADVTDSAAVDAVVEKALERFGRVDAVANCAGSAPLQPLDRLTDQTIDAAIAVNLKSVIYTTRAVWPAFRRQHAAGATSGGAICSVSSMASIDPFTGFNVYAAAKAGVNLFTKAAADEGRQMGVVCAAVAPGAIETPMLRENFPEKLIPADKTLDPMDVAGVIRDVLTGSRAVEPGETIVLPSP